jgi:sodium transport system ATP-binding protein
MLKIENISKKFNNFVALEDVSFEVKEGELFGLLGENGAGKTTMLRILSTIMTPTSGTAKVLNYDIVKNPQEVRSSIGILFGGETGLYERLTARENIKYYGELNDMPSSDIDKRIDELVKIFGMQEYIDKKVAGFSKGMKQKVSFARSIVHSPKVMLLDEPTSGLDVTAIMEVHNFIKECKNQGKTVIFSSHTMSEVEELCDRIAILHKGKIMDVGTQDELKKKYNVNTITEVFTKLVGEPNEL